jgi:hypothetical protein
VIKDDDEAAIEERATAVLRLRVVLRMFVEQSRTGHILNADRLSRMLAMADQVLEETAPS